MARPYRGPRAESFFIEVMTELGQHRAYITPAVGGQITITTGAPIARTLGGLVLRPGDWETIDLDFDLLRPGMVIDDVAYSLGVFCAVGGARHVTARGVYLELQCQDLGYLFTTSFIETWNLPAGNGIGTAIAALLDGLNIYDRALVESNPVNTAHLGKPIGAAVWDALVALTENVGLTPPWLNRNGTTRVIHAPVIGATPPAAIAWEAGDGASIVEGTLRYPFERWKVPDEWVVVGRSDQAVKYAGRYTRPVSSGRRRVRNIKVVELAGLATQSAADTAAANQAQTEPRVPNTAEMEVQPDPTLEPWDIRTHAGQGWLFDSCTWELRTGASQQVRIRDTVNA